VYVEEYKRPKNEIILEKSDRSYKAGDTLLVKGKLLSYSGYPIQDAHIKTTIRVSKNSSFLRYYQNSTVLKEFSLNDLRTDKNGAFSIYFPTDSIFDNTTEFDYLVQVSTVDLNGEVIEKSTSISVSNIDRYLSVQGEKIYIEGKNISLRIKHSSKSGNSIPFNGLIQLFKKETEPVVFKKEKFWSEADTLIHLHDSMSKYWNEYESNDAISHSTRTLIFKEL